MRTIMIPTIARESTTITIGITVTHALPDDQCVGVKDDAPSGKTALFQIAVIGGWTILVPGKDRMRLARDNWSTLNEITAAD